MKIKQRKRTVVIKKLA